MGFENRKESQIEKSAKSVIKAEDEEEKRSKRSMAWLAACRKEKKCAVFLFINLELSKSYKRSVN